jgi:gamma-butyrobetaine dioxygenase
MTDQQESIQVCATARRLRVRLADGLDGEFTAMWLRDNRPEDRDAHSGQRLVDITDLPRDPSIESARIEGQSLLVAWMDGTTTTYDLGWVSRQCKDPWAERPELRPRLWLEGARLDGTKDLAWCELETLVTDDSARLHWLTRLSVDGIAFLSGVPTIEGTIIEAMGHVGRVAETNYGLLFDVRSVARPENLAYSDFGLGLHTDNPYRDPVPGFQALHVLVSSPDGGDSLLGDGFALAEHLRQIDPESFRVLSTTPVPFLYRSAGAELYSEKPLIRLDVRGRVVAVHYNNRSIAPVNLPPEDSDAFYAAYRRFAGLLRDGRFQVRLSLGDGDLMVFDNQRTLHGRTAFSSARHPRHLQGCYLTRDSVLSEAAMLRRRLA